MAALPPCGSGLSTPEFLTVEKSWNSVISHIKGHLGDICDALFEKGLIPSAVRNLIRNPTIPEEEIAERVMEAIIIKVELKSSLYYCFLSILKSGGTWSDPLMTELEEIFKAEQAALADCSSDDAYHSPPDIPEISRKKPVKPQNTISFSKTMNCSDLCKWLLENRVPPHVVSSIREQSIDGESLLQLRLNQKELAETLKCTLVYGHYHKLANAIKQAQAIEREKEAQRKASEYMCVYCKKKSIRQVFSQTVSLHPKKRDSSPLFPYLKIAYLTENEKILLESQLMDDTKKMIQLFADTEDTLISSLETQNVGVTRVRNYLGNYVMKGGSKDDYERLKKTTDLYDLFFSLHPFKSFFHYEIIEAVMNKFGSIEVRQLMSEYVTKLNKFCQRGVFEVPPNIYHEGDPKPGDKLLNVKFTPEGRILLADIVALRRNVGSVLDIDAPVLQICCITESDGCVCLRFVIVAHMVDKVFPLSQAQLKALRDIHITVVDDLKIPEAPDVYTSISL